MPVYQLRDGTPTDRSTWEAKQADAGYVQVEKTTLPAGFWVSTVWLGLDEGLFETVVFDGATREGIDRARWKTEREAKAGHRALVEKWKVRQS